METISIICLSLGFVISIGMIIGIEIYNKKIKDLIKWIQFQISANGELMKMSGNNYERGLFSNGCKTAYMDIYKKIKSFN